MKAYHFFGDSLRDGTPVPNDGVKLVYTGAVQLSRKGYHASKHPYDALWYAPGEFLSLVEVSGYIIEGKDKLVASERTIIKRFDSGPLLRELARREALSVLHLWDAPDVVKEYLETGNEDLRVIACNEIIPKTYASAAARAATDPVARHAARNADRFALMATLKQCPVQHRDLEHSMSKMFKEMVDKKFSEMLS